MKLKFILTQIGALTICLFQAHAQVKDTTYWHRYFEAGFSGNQSAFNEHWKGGGLAALAYSALVNTKSEYNKYKHNVVNDLQLQYGRSNIKGVGQRKTVDRIFFDNVYNYFAFMSPKVSLFGSVTFQTQFDLGYTYNTHKNPLYGPIGNDSNNVISGFLAPGNLIEAAGVQWKPFSYLSARFGPVAFKQYFNINDRVKKDEFNPDGTLRDAGRLYGVENENVNVTNFLGANAIIKFDKDIFQNINIKAIYQYFTTYENLGVSTNRLDMIATAKVTKYITVNAIGAMLYDQTQSTNIQLSGLLGVGLAYKVKSDGTP